MAITLVDQKKKYDEDRFKSAMQDFSELEKIVAFAPQDNWNPTLRKNLGSLARDDQTHYAGMTPDQFRNDAEEAYTDSEDNVRAYAKRHFYLLLDKLDTEQLLSLVSALPLAETGKEDLDRIAKAVIEKRKIEGAARENKLEGYVQERLRDAEPWRQRAYFKYSIVNVDYNKRTFQAYAGEAEIELMKAISNGNGELDKGKLHNLLRESYAKIVADKGEDSNEAKDYQLKVGREVTGVKDYKQLAKAA